MTEAVGAQASAAAASLVHFEGARSAELGDDRGGRDHAQVHLPFAATGGAVMVDEGLGVGAPSRGLRWRRAIGRQVRPPGLEGDRSG